MFMRLICGENHYVHSILSCLAFQAVFFFFQNKYIFPAGIGYDLSPTTQALHENIVHYPTHTPA